MAVVAVVAVPLDHVECASPLLDTADQDEVSDASMSLGRQLSGGMTTSASTSAKAPLIAPSGTGEISSGRTLPSGSFFSETPKTRQPPVALAIPLTSFAASFRWFGDPKWSSPL